MTESTTDCKSQTLIQRGTRYVRVHTRPGHLRLLDPRLSLVDATLVSSPSGTMVTKRHRAAAKPQCRQRARFRKFACSAIGQPQVRSPTRRACVCPKRRHSRLLGLTHIFQDPYPYSKRPFTRGPEVSLRSSQTSSFQPEVTETPKPAQICCLINRPADSNRSSSGWAHAPQTPKMKGSPQITMVSVLHPTPNPNHTQGVFGEERTGQVHPTVSLTLPKRATEFL